MAENVIIDSEDDGQRLDRWIKKNYPAMPFGHVQKALRTGQVRVDGKRAKGDAKLSEGQTIRIPPQFTTPLPKKEEVLSDKDTAFIRSLVVYEDEHIIAINKPSGLASQGGTKINKHVDGMLDGLATDGKRPKLVHRLDKDTSGIMLLARDTKMAREMGLLFKSRDVRKYYWALTVRVPDIAQGKINVPIAKVPVKGGERIMGVDDDEGKHALTYYSVMESLGKKMAWISFWPKTGRMHQLRVHALEINCPILGDFKYAHDQEFFDENPELSKTLHLHARRIIFKHPVTGDTLDLSAPLTGGMRDTFEYFGLDMDDRSDPFATLD